MRRTKKERKQRIAEIEARLQSTRETLTASLHSSWDEIERLKEENISLKAKITDLESMLNVRYLLLNQTLELTGKTDISSYNQPSCGENVKRHDGKSLETTSSSTISPDVEQIAGSKDVLDPKAKRHTIPGSSKNCWEANVSQRTSKGNKPEKPQKIASLQNLRPHRTDKSTWSCPTAVHGSQPERSKIPLVVMASGVANKLRMRQEKAATSQQENDLRRVFNSMDAACAVTLQDLQSKLQGKEAAILTLQRAKVIQEVTLSSLDMELEDLEITNMSMEECCSKVQQLQSQSDELDVEISKMNSLLKTAASERGR